MDALFLIVFFIIVDVFLFIMGHQAIKAFDALTDIWKIKMNLK